MKFLSYKPCIGRKYRLIPKLYRPFVILINSNLCNEYILEKNKIRFINQLLRWFYKSRWGYKTSLDSKGTYNDIINGSNIILCTRTQKAAFKNLLLKLNYKLIDYKILKKRQYVLNFSFLFLNIEEKLNNNIFFDILSYHEDKFRIFVILNGYYIKDFNNIIYYYNTFIYNQYYENNFIKEINENNFNIFDIKINLSNNDIFEYVLDIEKNKDQSNYELLVEEFKLMDIEYMESIDRIVY